MSTRCHRDPHKPRTQHGSRRGRHGEQSLGRGQHSRNTERHGKDAGRGSQNTSPPKPGRREWARSP
eukprot:1256819-Pyramimonas_sp.AAC.1